VREVRVPLPDEGRRQCSHLQAQQVLDLAGEDDERDPGGETGGHRVRDELDHPAQSREAERDEHHPRHQRRDREPVVAVLLHDPVHDHHERPGRAADLHPRTAQERDQEAGDHRGIESALGRHPARDGEGDGQRQRHDPDDDAGIHVGAKLLPGVALHGGEELRYQHDASHQRSGHERRYLSGFWKR
jgi:hypothetical protein